MDFNINVWLFYSTRTISQAQDLANHSIILIPYNSRSTNNPRDRCSTSVAPALPSLGLMKWPKPRAHGWLEEHRRFSHFLATLGGLLKAHWAESSL